MKIGLYFGSFNPIHHGHLIIAQHIINQSLVDQIWFIISPQNPLKKATSLLNEHHRKYLVEIAIINERKLKASNVEFNLPRPSYTIDTLIYLKEKFPDHSFEIILGSDSFKNISKWKNYEILIQDYQFLIFPRKDFKLDRVENANCRILNAPLIEISSTHIRNMIKDGLSIDYLVPEKVKEEIERNGYYKLKNQS